MESFMAYHGVNAATHQQRFDELLSQGMRLTWINVSGDPGWLASPEPARQELPSPLPDTPQNQEREIIEAALA